MTPFDPRDAAATWPERERQWRVALGRIKLGVEPIPEQLERYRLVTWTVTIVAGGMGTMILALFAAFRHPLIGMAVSGIIFGPVIVSAWIGFARLVRRTEQYLRERQEVERLRTTPETKKSP